MKGASVTPAASWTTAKDGIYFPQNGAYTALNPPPGWPLSPLVLAALAALTPPVVLPSSFTYLNLGKIKDKGIELGVAGAGNRYLNVFTNYSYQWMPVAENLPPGRAIADINWPAKN